MFFVFNNMPIFFRFIPSASLVDKKITKGLLFLRWDFAAISTGVSDIPFASFDKVLPVHGDINKISTKDLGPMGSASGIVVIGGLPDISSAFFKKSSL